MSAADILAATITAPPPAFDSDLPLTRTPIPTTVEGWTEAIMQGSKVCTGSREIRHIGQTIRDVKAAFERVGESLAQFDQAQYLDWKDNMLQPGGQWREYEAIFRALVERSQYKASAVGALLHQYNKAIMTDVDKSEFPKLKNELLPFAEELGSRRTGVKRMVDEMRAFVDDIRRFEVVIDEDFRGAGSRLERQYGEGSAQQRSLAYHQGAVDSHKKDLRHAAEGMSMIANIWIMIAADLQTMEVHMSNSIHPDVPLTMLFKRKIALLRPRHGMLTAVCNIFYNQARSQER